MDNKCNRSMCVSHMGDNLMVRMYWDTKINETERKEHERGVDVSNPTNVRKAQAFLVWFRDLICGVALSGDGLFVVYNFENATPEQIKKFDATVSQVPTKTEKSTMRGAGYKGLIGRKVVSISEGVER